MSAHYQRFLKLLEKWPIDKSKSGRDFGEHLRKHVQTLVNPVAVSAETSDILTKQIESLEKLANNTYGSQFDRSNKTTATGLTAVQCNQVLSSEFLQYLSDDKGSAKDP